MALLSIKDRTNRGSLLAEQFFSVFEEADDYDDGRTHEPEEEHQFKEPHKKNCHYHAKILTHPDVLHSPLYAIQLEVGDVAALGRCSSLRHFA